MKLNVNVQKSKVDYKVTRTDLSKIAGGGGASL